MVQYIDITRTYDMDASLEYGYHEDIYHAARGFLQGLGPWEGPVADVLHKLWHMM